MISCDISTELEISYMRSQWLNSRKSKYYSPKCIFLLYLKRLVVDRGMIAAGHGDGKFE